MTKIFLKLVLDGTLQMQEAPRTLNIKNKSPEPSISYSNQTNIQEKEYVEISEKKKPPQSLKIKDYN